LRKELLAIGDSMTTDWLKTAGAEGQAIVDAYRKR
jgi:TRAP-type transport system periplasmic protein